MSKELYSPQEIKLLDMEQKLHEANCTWESQNEEICELKREIDDQIACVGNMRLVASFKLSHSGQVTKEELVTLDLILVKSGNAVGYMFKWHQLHAKEYDRCPFDGKLRPRRQETVEESFIDLREVKKRVAWPESTDESRKFYGTHGWIFSRVKHPWPHYGEIRNRFGFDEFDHEKMCDLISGQWPEPKRENW